MRSIVVLGDVRLHQLRDDAHEPQEHDCSGGALMMGSAIASAFDAAKIALTPHLYSYEQPTTANPLRKLGLSRDDPAAIRSWTAKKIDIGTGKVARYCLFPSENDIGGSVRIPEPSNTLVKALATEGFRGGTKAPDIVVIDDLGLVAGALKFERNSGSFERIETSIADEREAAERLQAAEKELELIQADSKSATTLSSGRKNVLRHFERQLECNESVLRETLSLLSTRLSEAAREVEATGGSNPAEPVVIYSIAGKIPPLQSDHSGPMSADDSAKLTFLQHIYRSRAIRRRTIVLFDAKALREVISISSGLSWERTAQDAVVEFRRNKLLRDYLQFGFVIIRFGLNGLLLISNEGATHSSHILYFNPDEDDRAWSHNEDGEVLGATSILVATIVEQLDRRCHWREGKSRLPDIPRSIDQALLLAINRMVNNFEIGYGRDLPEFLDTLNGFPAKTFATRSDIIRRELAPHKNPDGTDLSRIVVQRVQLQTLRSRHWSILAQSSQADLNDISSQIVLRGSKAVINTMEQPIEDFVNAWIDETLSRMRKDDPDYTLVHAEKHKTESRLSEQLLETLNELLLNEVGTAEHLLGEASFQAVNTYRKAIQRDENIRFNKLCDSLSAQRATLRARLSEARAILVDNSIHRGLDHLLGGLSADGRILERSLIHGLHELRRLAADTGAEDMEHCLLELERSRLPDFRRELFDLSVSAIESSQVRHGIPRSVSTPVLQLGKPPAILDGKLQTDGRLLVIDRTEVESIRAIKRMIEQYLRAVKQDRSEVERPLSIAVFGPPGSGKSVAVKSMIEMMDNIGQKTKRVTINLTKLSGIDDLNKRLFELKDIRERDGAVPVVFFDEFDAGLDQKSSGWLKYFLPVMEDSDPVREAIYIFAGGTSDSFESFSLADRSRTDQQWIEFANQKGPDFVSRLSGHHNVVGINPTNPDDDLYLIRRALALRFLISRKLHLGEAQTAPIDEHMINAFLHVPHYIHGVRSMRMLVDLCYQRDMNCISMSEVPPIHQLDMQVDGKAFAMLASGQTKPTKLDDHFEQQ